MFGQPPVKNATWSVLARPPTHSHRTLIHTALSLSPRARHCHVGRTNHRTHTGTAHTHGRSTRTCHTRKRNPRRQPTPLSTPFSRRYRALSSSIEKDGFKSALLLRLAPVLPIPIDAHWYVAGCTPLKLPTFFCAYFVGALKVRPEFDHRSIRGAVAAGREGGVRPAH